MNLFDRCQSGPISNKRIRQHLQTFVGKCYKGTRWEIQSSRAFWLREHVRWRDARWSSASASSGNRFDKMWVGYWIGLHPKKINEIRKLNFFRTIHRFILLFIVSKSAVNCEVSISYRYYNAHCLIPNYRNISTYIEIEVNFYMCYYTILTISKYFGLFGFAISLASLC